MVRSLKTLKQTRKRRRTRGGGFLNRIKSFFGAKPTAVAPRPTTYGTIPVAVPTVVPTKANTVQNWKPKPVPRRTLKLPTFPKFKPTRKVEIVKANFTKMRRETFTEGLERLMWYLQKRREGYSHTDLLPYLKTPGSMVLTPQAYEELKQLLLNYQKEDPETAIERLKTEVFHAPDLDKEINDWEKAVPASDEERQLWCGPKGTCTIFPGTKYEKFAEGNIANSLSRLIGLLMRSTNRNLQYRTNYRAAQECDSGFYTVLSNPSAYEAIDENIDRNLAVVNPTYLNTPIGYFCFEKLLETRFILDAIVAKQLYFVSPFLGLWLQDTHPDLYSTAFSTASGWGFEDTRSVPYEWKRLSSLERIRMLTLQYFAAKKVYMETGNGNEAQRYFLSFPEPTLSKIRSMEGTNEYSILQELFTVNQETVKKTGKNIGNNSGNNSGKKILSLPEYLQYLEQRSLLFKKPTTHINIPGNRNFALTPEPYDPETEQTNINRVGFYAHILKSSKYTAKQKAEARGILSLARLRLEQGESPFMTEAELERATLQFPEIQGLTSGYRKQSRKSRRKNRRTRKTRKTRKN